MMQQAASGHRMRKLRALELTVVALRRLSSLQLGAARRLRSFRRANFSRTELCCQSAWAQTE